MLQILSLLNADTVQRVPDAHTLVFACCVMVLWLLLSSTWTVPCTFVLHLPIDQATTVVFHNKQINNSCHSSLIMPSQYLDQVPPLLHRTAETMLCMNKAKLRQNWSESSAAILWDTNTTHHEFLSKMLRNRVSVLISQDKIHLRHSYPVPQCLKYTKRYFCLSLNTFVCWWVCVCGLMSTCISITITPQ